MTAEDEWTAQARELTDRDRDPCAEPTLTARIADALRAAYERGFDRGSNAMESVNNDEVRDLTRERDARIDPAALLSAGAIVCVANILAAYGITQPTAAARAAIAAAIEAARK